MTVGSKLYTGCGITLVVSLLMGVFAIGNMAQLGREIEALGLVSAQNLFLSGDVNNLTSDALASINGMVLRAHLHDPDQVRQNYETAISDLKQITKENGAFIEGVSDPNLRQKAQTEIQDKLEQETELTNEVYGLITKSDLPGADELSLNQLIPLATAVSYVDNDVSQKTNQEIKQEVSHSLERIGPARTLSLVMMLFVMMVGGVLLWVVLGINKALRSSVDDLQSGADQLAQAAAQVSSSSQALAQGATEQAASLMESSASSEQINSMARRNADNSRSTAELLSGSQQKVTEANDLLQGAVVSMDQIASSSGQISKIIKAIDEIAFQTNILALNAAVEAARAGEAGLGFAVVADEVRSLAQRSAQAAKDTATLIEDSIVKSGNGKSRVDQVALAIASVTEDTARVKVMVDEVSSGSEEQSRGIDQIGRAISKMEQVTQNAAASAEQSAAAAEELNAQSMAMKEVVGRLQVMIGGASVIPVSRPAAARSYARI